MPVVAGVEPADLTERIDRQARSCAQRIRQHVALELANIHLRVVKEIVFGVGCAGLPQLLDREMEALSLLATAQCDEAVRGIVDDAAARVFGAPLAEGVRRRIVHAVRWGLADHPDGRELDRVLLVTSTAGVAGLAGAGALDALAGCPGAERDEALPPVGVALNGGPHRCCRPRHPARLRRGPPHGRPGRRTRSGRVIPTAAPFRFIGSPDPVARWGAWRLHRLRRSRRRTPKRCRSPTGLG
ncbi:hypothetical protein B0E53_04405 [Micromonospora sp. MH33]|nr:hypothetical protein B0E53_04405 [Micromonospora sp. MH33]